MSKLVGVPTATVIYGQRRGTGTFLLNGLLKSCIKLTGETNPVIPVHRQMMLFQFRSNSESKGTQRAVIKAFFLSGTLLAISGTALNKLKNVSGKGLRDGMMNAFILFVGHFCPRDCC